MKYEIDSKIKVLEKRRFSLKKKNLEAKIFRTRDSFFKYIMDGEVLEKFAKEVVGKFFGTEINSVSEKLDNEFKVSCDKRDFKLDNVFRADDFYCDVEMENCFILERFFIYWGILVTSRRKGESTKDLTTPNCLQVIIARNGIKSKDRWAECWQTFPRDYDTGEVLGKATTQGINVLVLDLQRFKELVPKPNPTSFTENFLMYLLTENISETIKMYQDKQYAILEDVFNRECSFLDDRYKWGVYMRKDKDIRDAENKIKDQNEIIQKQAEALQKAEADKAKAEAEAKAKDAKLQKALARIKELEEQQKA